MSSSSPPTPLYLPHSLPFPLTVQRLLKPTGTQVRKLDSLFTYSFKAPVEGGKPGEVERQVRVWECPVEGDIVRWDIKEGEQLLNASNAFISIQEPCTHDVQLHGMCALCGKDLNATDYTGFSDSSRANISMVHDVGALKVSLEEAKRLEQQTTTRLLKTKKLSLIVDLDQTIVHATVDPTVGEWLDDEANPNFSALSGTQKFNLNGEVDDKGQPVYYYVKPRPGLHDFLTEVASKYEMHVYTMGTRAYAIEVCKIIDPRGDFFGGRILSRDESGSMTRKSLQRLFPCETNMVVIIDDRADVWDGAPNLVKVIPFEFFVGIGDINSAFLPKKKELAPPPTNTPPTSDPTATADPAASGSSSTPLGTSDASSTISDLVVTPNTEAVVSPSLSEAQASTAATIHDQIEDRPLSRAQATVRSSKADDPTPSSSSVVDESEVAEDDEDEEDEMAAAILKDDDRELDRLLTILSDVHGEFFANPQQGDVERIIPDMKRRTLAGVTLVLSGLVPLGTRPQDSEYSRLATTFGANCAAELHSKVTHVVANQGGTAKVHQARRMKGVKVVGERWLVNSAAHWRRLAEEDYPVLDPAGAGQPPPVGKDNTAPAAPELILTHVENDQEVLDLVGAPAENEDVTDDESVDGEVDLGDFGWADANKEIEDALNETDDDDEAEESDAASANGEDEEATTDGESAVSKSPPRKRTRVNTAGEDDADDGRGSTKRVPPPKAVPPKSPVDSPLQKRVKNSRSRRSRLKVELTAGEEGDKEQADDDDTLSQASSRAPSPLPPSPMKVAGAGVSVVEDAVEGSSSLDSDDEAFFASMAAEVEMGFQA